MTTLFLVRHAVTAHTGRKLSGWLPDIHLSDDGRRQARSTAEMLAEVPLKAVYSSPIDRTVETAMPIAERHGLQVQRAEKLGEVEFGRWTDRSLKALARTKLWTTVQQFPSAARFPEGESLREVQARALEEVEGIRSAHARQAVCVVSHGDVIKLIAAHYLGVHIDLFQRIVISPASVSVIALSDDTPRVVSLNTSPLALSAGA